MGLSQAALARHLGVSRLTILRYEKRSELPVIVVVAASSFVSGRRSA